MGIDRKQVRSAAQKQVRKGNWNKAIAKYETLVDSDPDDVRSRLKLADLYTRVDREDEAVEAYREAGDRHAQQDIYQKAVAVYKQAIRLEPEDPALHQKVGEAYHRLDRLKDAVQAFKRAHDIYKEAGELGEQLEMLEELVRLDPEDVGLRIQLAETYAKQGEDDAALRHFREAAEMLAEEGHHDEYVQVAERILYFDPDDLDVRKRAIQIYIDQGDNKRALKHLQVCFQSNTRDEQTLRQLAETFMRLDRTEKAALVFQKLASIHREAGRLEEARRTWQRLLQIDPTNEAAQQGLRTYGEPESRADSDPLDEESERTDSREIPAISEDEERTTSGALDEIEFIDESSDSGPQTPEPREGVTPEHEAETNDERVAATTDSSQEPPVDGAPPPTSSPAETPESRTAEPSTGDNPGEAERNRERSGAPAEPEVHASLQKTPPEGGADGPSPSSEREREPTDQSLEAPVDREQLDRDDGDGSLGETSSTGSDELDELLNEADVFLKYGLHDKARDVIHKILERAPNNLAAYDKRRRLYAALDEPRAEAATLVDMARMSSHQPPKARHFLRKALEVGGADRQVAKAASDLDIDLPESTGDADHAESPPPETQPSMDRPGDPPSSLEQNTSSPEREQRTPRGRAQEFESIDVDEAESTSGAAAPPEEEEDEILELETITSEADDPQKPDDAPAEGDEEHDEEILELDDEDVELIEEGEPKAPPGPDIDANDAGSDVRNVFSSSGDIELPREDSEATADSGEAEDPTSLGFTETEVEGALDGLFDGVDDTSDLERSPGSKTAEGRDELAAVESLIEKGAYDNARAALESFADAHPDHPAVEKCRQRLEEAVDANNFERQPTGARSLTGEFKAKAVETDSDADSLEAGVVNTNLEVGTAYREMGMYDDAIDEFRQAIEDPDAAAAAKYNIALCKAEQGALDEATEVLSRLAENGDISADVRSAARTKLEDLDSTQS